MSESKPRVYYAVWEDATLNDDDSVDEDGFCAGAISTRGGGNLHWDENQFQVVHKDDYDALKRENERLKEYEEHVWKYVQDGNTSHLFLGHHVGSALVQDHARLKAELNHVATTGSAVAKERDRALAMLEKMAGAIDVAIRGLVAKGIGNAALNDALAEYRKEFGPQSNVLTENKLD